MKNKLRRREGGLRKTKIKGEEGKKGTGLMKQKDKRRRGKSMKDSGYLRLLFQRSKCGLPMTSFPIVSD